MVIVIEKFSSISRASISPSQVENSDSGPTQAKQLLVMR